MNKNKKVARRLTTIGRKQFTNWFKINIEESVDLHERGFVDMFLFGEPKIQFVDPLTEDQKQYLWGQAVNGN